MPEFYVLTKITCEEKHCGECKRYTWDGYLMQYLCQQFDKAFLLTRPDPFQKRIRCQACLDAQKVVEARLLDQHIDHLNYFSEAWKEIGTSDLSKFARNALGEKDKP
jgi:hypothetical protein